MPTNCKKSLILVLVVLAIGLLDFTWINRANQTYAKDYLNESIALSAGTYATCRIINGGVSSLQESSISISPWGIGIEYEAGQVLDPINDATERLSDACVKSMALLGVQRLLLSVVNHYTIIPFYGLLAAFVVSVFVLRNRKLALFAGRLAILLALLRVSTPLLCLVGSQANHRYFAPQVQEQQQRLKAVKEIAMEEFKAEVPRVEIDAHVEGGSLESIARFFSNFRDRIIGTSSLIKHRVTSLGRAVGYMKDHFDEISESLAMLFVLVIEKVIVQVFVLPLLVWLLMRKAFQWLAGESLDGWIRGLWPDGQEPRVGAGNSGSVNGRL